MSEFVLSCKPALDLYGVHDPSAAIFEGGEIRFAVEEERYTRTKHADNTFPAQAIRACLDHCDVTLDDVEKVVVPYRADLIRKNFFARLRREATAPKSVLQRVRAIEREFETQFQALFSPTTELRAALREVGDTVPPIEHESHHACHAASAFHPCGFDDALILTIDGVGEYDSTVVWHGDRSGIERLRTHDHPNSLGHFFGVVTEYLGFRAFNGEGKVMGLAPYGERDDEIESLLRELVDTSADYDVTDLTGHGIAAGVERLEALFDRKRKVGTTSFDRFHKDVARVAQHLLEETVTNIVTHFASTTDQSRVCLAGGVALNCKMNRRVRELDCVDEVFTQPVAHDGGLAIGAGYLGRDPASVDRFTDPYLGPSFDAEQIESTLTINKIDYHRPDDLERYVAEKLADGALVGWFQGRMEMGPRALGNRSILADPRTVESRDRVNEYVKHREEWRPFAPSMLAEAADEYLDNATPSPFMIDTFSTNPEQRDSISAVLHPADATTRPQTVTAAQNPRYYRLIEEFREITGVPVVLNTSFNDHAEPIVRTPTHALKDFYGMGLDVLALGDFVVEKVAAPVTDSRRGLQQSRVPSE